MLRQDGTRDRAGGSCSLGSGRRRQLAKRTEKKECVGLEEARVVSVFCVRRGLRALLKVIRRTIEWPPPIRD